jgi:hypothetical protein
MHSNTPKSENTRISAGLCNLKMDDTGPAQPKCSAGKQRFQSIGDATSDANTTGTHWNPTESPELLAQLAAAWSVLTNADRSAIVELAERFTLANRDGVTVDV